jgi:hypothetical protein
MKQNLIVFLAILIVLFLPAQISAGGSFRFDTELEPILNQKPELKEFILETFDIAESGWTPNRIGWQVNKKFGGRRLGPYHINAKPKEHKGVYVFELIFHTEHIFIDKNGNKTQLTNAEIIKENFKSLEIRVIE